MFSGVRGGVLRRGAGRIQQSSHMRRVDLAEAHAALGGRLLDRSAFEVVLPERLRDNLAGGRAPAPELSEARAVDAVSEMSARAERAIARVVGSLRRGASRPGAVLRRKTSSAPARPDPSLSGVVRLLDVHVQNLGLLELDDAFERAEAAEERRQLLAEAGGTLPPRGGWVTRRPTGVEPGEARAVAARADELVSRAVGSLRGAAPAAAPATQLVDSPLAGALLADGVSALEEALDLAEAAAEEDARLAEHFPSRCTPAFDPPPARPAAPEAPATAVGAAEAVLSQLERMGTMLPDAVSRAPPARAFRPGRLDVLGNEVVNLYPRLVSARDAGNPGQEPMRWADVLMPQGLTDAQRVQWEQERRELAAVDAAVDAHKLRFFGLGRAACGREEPVRQPTLSELLGKSSVKQRILRYHWHSALASNLRRDMEAVALGSGEAKAELRREDIPPSLLTKLVCETAPSPRTVAIHALSRWSGEQHPRHAGEGGYSDDEAWQGGETVLAGAAAAMRSRLLGLPCSAPPAAVRAALRAGGSEPRLVAAYEAELGRSIASKAEVLAALSLQVVLQQALQAHDPHGVKAARLCARLGRDVRLHFWRDAIYQAELDAAKRRTRAAAAELARLGADAEADERRRQLLSQARMPHELLTYLQEMNIKQTSIAVSLRGRQSGGAEPSAAGGGEAADEGAAAGGAGGAGGQWAAGAPLSGPPAEEELASLGAQWGDKDAVKIGAYLVSRLMRNSIFSLSTEAGGRGVPWEDAPQAARPEADGCDDASSRMLAAASSVAPAASSCAADLEQAGRAVGWEKALRHTLVPVPGRTRSRWTQVGYVSLHGALVEGLLGDPDALRTHVMPDEAPMLAPPLAWCKEEGAPPLGGFLHQPSQLMRTFSRLARHRLRAAPPEQLAPVFDGLNACAATAWRVNPAVLSVVESIGAAFPDGLGVLPTNLDLPLPAAPAGDDQDALRLWKRELKQARQRNAELHSLRCTLALKVGVARELGDRPFYFAYNLDFRGRAYPMSPHLSPVGDDLARGMLRYAAPRRVGAAGLRWLKVHAASLYGHDKLPLHERVAWTDEQLAAGRLKQLAAAPLDEPARGWWLAADNPLQFYAVALDLAAAYARESPEEHESAIPVAQDGSCNGLQHYAALGRDARGGRHVNLVPGDRPGDVYTGVLDVVRRKVEEDAAGGDEERAAMAAQLHGRLTRKVVKQTVMTTVYGVTFIGARDQIERRLRELPELKAEIADPRRYTQLAAYCARLTLDSLGEVFEPAMVSMDWLAKSADAIGREALAPVEWTTPLGLPVVQPYHKAVHKPIRTILQSMNLVDDADPDQPADVRRQVMALPPNYVHSLDSSHMLMTASACRRAGIAFAAVHDSYWSHACDVDAMNAILRDQFVDLHRPNLLQRLRDEWLERYACCRGEGAACAEYDPGPESAHKQCAQPGCKRVRWDAPGVRLPMPARGELDIGVVRDSTYFFA